MRLHIDTAFDSCHTLQLFMQPVSVRRHDSDAASPSLFYQLQDWHIIQFCEKDRPVECFQGQPTSDASSLPRRPSESITAINVYNGVDFCFYFPRKPCPFANFGTSRLQSIDDFLYFSFKYYNEMYPRQVRGVPKPRSGIYIPRPTVGRADMRRKRLNKLISNKIGFCKIL